MEEVVIVLRADEPLETAGPRGPVCIGDLPPREVRAPQISDLALVNELGERSEGLGDRCPGIGCVELIEVDPVRPEPSER